MPVILQSSLSTFSKYARNGLAVTAAGSSAAAGPALEVAFLNLMPAKRAAEEQIVSLFAESPYRVHLPPFRVDSPEFEDVLPRRQKDWRHAVEHYLPVSRFEEMPFDALIINGAPLGQKRFEDVSYWPELTRLYDLASGHVESTLNICWAAAAALKHFHGIERQLKADKHFGVYSQQIINPHDELVIGQGSSFSVPVSRYSTVHPDQLRTSRDVSIVATNSDAGVGLARDHRHHQVLCFNHPEYSADTLAREYWRDYEQGLHPRIPHNTFPDNDLTRHPELSWREARRSLSHQWVHEVASRVGLSSPVPLSCTSALAEHKIVFPRMQPSC